MGVAALAVVALAAVACDGGGDSPSSPTPAGATPVITPGSGISPAQAVGTYISAKGLDGHELELNTLADCPLEETPDTATPEGTPSDEPASPTPTSTPQIQLVSRAALGQFCLTIEDLQLEDSVTVIVELPDTGETWDMKLEWDSDASVWQVKDVEKVSG